MENLFDIKGKVVVMTGACGVLGSTIVKYFAAQGCKVVLLDLERVAEKGVALVADIKAAGGEAMFLPIWKRSSRHTGPSTSCSMRPAAIWDRPMSSPSRPSPTWTSMR